MTASVRWVTAMLDSPPETARASERFWAQATGTRLSARRGDRAEFATLLPDEGDAFLKVQEVIQSVPGAMHLDVHSDDVRGLAERAERLGASASYHVLGYVMCGSPGGMTFCIVGHPARRRPPPQQWAAGRSIVDQVCLDIPRAAHDEECAFWSAVTGQELVEVASPEFTRLRRPDGQPLQLLLQKLDEPTGAVRGHLDLAADDRAAEVRRHVLLGARLEGEHDHWTVLSDPAGAPYCITDRSPRSGRREDRAG
jgi:hypothetical protein